MGERAVPQLGSLDLRLSQGLLQHLSVYIPSSNFSKKKKQKQMLPGQQDGKIPCVLQTSLYSRNVSSTLNCRQTLLLGPADWVIFIFLFRIMTSSLRNLLCLPPVHTSPTTSLLQICLHTFESHGRYHLGSKSLPAPPCYFSCCK